MSGSLIDLIAAILVVGTVASLAAPLTGSAIDSSRARQAAGYAASELRLAKQGAVTRSASTGLVFDLLNGRWTYQVCTDGNGNGVRRAEIRGGPDACRAPVDLESLFPSVRVAMDPTIRGPAGEAPSSDPVRFGASNLASFSPTGGCTAGSLFLRSTKGAQYAVRIASVTGRLRVLRYDYASQSWREG